MDLIWQKFTEWLKELLVSGIMDNVNGLFDNVNSRVAGIAGQVGATPQGWNSGVYGMIRTLSDNVILPIAGVVLAFVMTLELIQLITEKNNMHDVDTWMFFKWIFKTACAVLIVTNTWNIVMGVFEAAQSVVNSASGIIISDTSLTFNEHNTSKNYVIRAEHFSDGIDAAEEVLPGIKNDLLLGKYKPRETDVAAIAKAAPEERREKAEQLRVIPEKKPKADKESARSGTKRRQEVYATIGKSYEDMKDSKRVTEDSALVSLRYTARNMVETCDVLFTNFPGLLEKPDYKDQVIEIMQEPKQYILKLEGETDNEQHENTLQADGGQQPGFGDSRCVPAQAEHRACGKDRGRVQ